MTNPVRIQRLRTKGFDIQAASMAANGLPCVYVGRPTKWGNPFIVGKPGGQFTAKVKDRRHAYLLYQSVAPLNSELIAAAIRELRGKNLACWCPLDQPCHADVLLKLVNGGAS